jgi:hypothetical protein
MNLKNILIGKNKARGTNEDINCLLSEFFDKRFGGMSD